MFQNCQALDASIVTALRQFLSSVPPGVWRFAWRLALSIRGILSAPGSKETMWRFRSMAYTVSSQEVNSPPWPTLNSTFSKTWGSRRATRVRRQLSRTCHGEGCVAKFMVHRLQNKTWVRDGQSGFPSTMTLCNALFNGYGKGKLSRLWLRRLNASWWICSEFHSDSTVWSWGCMQRNHWDAIAGGCIRSDIAMRHTRTPGTCWTYLVGVLLKLQLIGWFAQQEMYRKLCMPHASTGTYKCEDD